jgi:hypothetical protein
VHIPSSPGVTLPKALVNSPLLHAREARRFAGDPGGVDGGLAGRADGQLGRAVLQQPTAERVVGEFGIDFVAAHGGEAVEVIPLEPLRAAIVDARAQIAALVVPQGDFLRGVLKMLPCIIFEQVVEQGVAAGELAVELLLFSALAGVVLALVSRLRIKQVASGVEGEGFLAQAAGGGEQPV